jgi:flavin reductase (NADH)/cob(II)yrinic acid a,c-diamide reductase
MNAASQVAVSDDFKEAFTRFAATVSVITYTEESGEPAGMTATSVCSLSLEPLSLLVCVNRENRSHASIVGAGRFGVNMLAAGQELVADRCSRPGDSKALPEQILEVVEPPSPPVLSGCVAHIECEVADVHTAHTHSIFVGHARSVELGQAQHPLLYCNRSYRRFDDSTEDEALQRVWDRVAFGALS